MAVLESAGVAFTVGEEAVRAAHIAALLQEDLPLEFFDLSVLREGRGWAVALASTLNELEGAELFAAQLATRDDPRCRDLAALLHRLDGDAGASWTAARLLTEASSLLAGDSRTLWPYGGPCLVELRGDESSAMARWLRIFPAHDSPRSRRSRAGRPS